MTFRIRTLVASILAVIFVTLAVPPKATSAPRVPPPKIQARRTSQSLHYAPGQLVVISEEGLLDATFEGSLISRDREVTAIFARLGLQHARSIGPSSRAGAKARPRSWLLQSDRGDFDPIQATRELTATGKFRAVSPNYRFGLFATIPNDFYLSIDYQWYIDDGGFADIHLPQAWDIERGDSSITIAIMDTGVDTSHPDFAGKIWHNPGEIPGNGLDDDGNGLIDDYEGWDFGMGDNDPKPEPTSDPSGIDVGFHGTFCAGIAAAATDNEEGIASAGWNCRIMPLKASQPDSGITSEAIAGAFDYAVDKEASVISMSFGGPGSLGVPEFFQALVDMATESGAVCVAAAGNANSSIRTYPAACDKVLAVAATTSTNERASFSNWGLWVDVAAPGEGMWSTICDNYTFSDLDQLYYEALFLWDSFNPYMYGDGTSFACPLTAGVCGLVRARYPNLTPQQVIQQVIATGDVVAYDHPVGRKVNAFRAVSLTPTAVALDARAPGNARIAAAPNPMSGSGEIRFVVPEAGPVRLVLFDAAGRRVRTIVDAMLPAGAHAEPWDGRNDQGTSLGTGIYFMRMESRRSVVTAKMAWIATARSPSR